MDVPKSPKPLGGRISMKRKCIFSLFAAFLVLCVWGMSSAEVELTIERTLKPEGGITDVAVSADGKWIYILTGQGTIHVCGADGRLHGTVRVDESTDRMRIGPQEDMLILTNRSGFVQVVTVDIIQDINVAGSPFKGAAEASVVITVFSDFQ